MLLKLGISIVIIFNPSILTGWLRYDFVQRISSHKARHMCQTLYCVLRSEKVTSQEQFVEGHIVSMSISITCAINRRKNLECSKDEMSISGKEAL